MSRHVHIEIDGENISASFVGEFGIEDYLDAGAAVMHHFLERLPEELQEEAQLEFGKSLAYDC